MDVRVVVDLLQRLQHRHAVGKYPVGEQEGVQEIDREEAQVRQAFQEPLGRGIADVGDLSGREESRVFSISCKDHQNHRSLFEDVPLASGRIHIYNIFSRALLCLHEIIYPSKLIDIILC